MSLLQRGFNILPEQPPPTPTDTSPPIKTGDDGGLCSLAFAIETFTLAITLDVRASNCVRG